MTGASQTVRMLRCAAYALVLASCGLQPVYSGGSRGSVATALAAIEVSPIPDQAGYLVGGKLRARLGTTSARPQYRLNVTLDDAILGFGIRGDNSVTRERRTLRARFTLVRVTDASVVVDATATADAGIDRVSSDYAVVAAENTALERLAESLADQIVTRLALAERQGTLSTK